MACTISLRDKVPNQTVRRKNIMNFALKIIKNCQNKNKITCSYLYHTYTVFVNLTFKIC